MVQLYVLTLVANSRAFSCADMLRYFSLNVTYNIRKFTKLGEKGPKDYEKEERY